MDEMSACSGTFGKVTTVEEAKAVLTEHGCSVVEEIPIPHGVQLRCDGGQVVSVYDSGKVVVQGKNTEGLEGRLTSAPTAGVSQDPEGVVITD